VSRGKKSYRQQSAEGTVNQKETRAARIVETRGSLTFDSYLCCKHQFVSVKAAQEDERTLINKVILKPGQKLEFEFVCAECGAGATFGEVYGRRKVVAYDRDWNFGIAPPPPSRDEREEREAAKRISQANAPVTWEDGISS
jgi:hypothetical protein